MRFRLNARHPGTGENFSGDPAAQRRRRVAIRRGQTVAELDITRRRFRLDVPPGEQVTVSNPMPYCGCKGIMIITTFDRIYL